MEQAVKYARDAVASPKSARVGALQKERAAILQKIVERSLVCGDSKAETQGNVLYDFEAIAAIDKEITRAEADESIQRAIWWAQQAEIADN